MNNDLYEMSGEHKVLVQNILNNMFNIIISNTDISGYAFKGGYIMGNYISPNKGLRYSNDLDMSVSSKIEFKKIIDCVLPYVESLKQKGIIYKYVIKEPIVTPIKKMSGGIILYYKPSENKKAFKLCNIDISLQNLSYGVIYADGFKRFSLERMIGDKVSVLYSDKSTLIRRIRDLYDLYIFNLLDEMLNPKLLTKCLLERGVNIKEKSTFEKLLQNKEDCIALADACSKLLKDGVRIDKEMIIQENISFKKIISSVLSLLTVLRGKK